MATPTTSVPFKSAIEALGGSISEAKEKSPNWEFYEIKYPTPAGPMVAHYLYLFHRCPLQEATPENIRRWKSLSDPHKGYSVVVATRSDLAKDLKKTKRAFSGESVTTTRQLLNDNVLCRFTPKETDDLEDRYFIGPDLLLPDGTTRPALQYLTNWLRDYSAPGSTPCAAILVAGAGLGKTTLCRAIAASILQNRDSSAIPIRVESEQWRNLIQPTLTLPNVLNAALLQTFPDAGLLTNPKVFQVLVRERLLIPIFDGFDELCLHPNSPYSASTLLNELLDLIGDTGARVLITTRETFWDKYKEEIPPDRIAEIRLKGFSNDQRIEFFRKRLNSSADRDTASRIARDIGGSVYPGLPREEIQALRPNGVPLILELIAVYVDGNPDATFAPDTADSLGPLLQALCGREVVRQQLPISAVDQMTIFEELFRDYPDEIPRDVLEMYVQVYAPTVTADVVSRFEAHALLSPGAPLRPRFEILKVYFVARWLAKSLEAAVSNHEIRRTVAGLLARNASGNTDVMDWLEDRFVEMDEAKRTAAIKHAIEMIKASPQREGACSALFHLTARVARRVESERTSRTAFIAKHFSDPSHATAFVELALQGQIEGLDLAGIRFEKCAFRDVEFRNCRFSETSEFVQSRFDGCLEIESCERPGSASVIDCELSAYAERTWDRISGKQSRPEVRDSVVREALRETLCRFVGTYGFSTIKYIDRNSGAMNRNPLRDAVWDELLRAGVIERHHISGVDAGGLNIKKDDKIRHEVRLFTDNAVLGPILEKVRQRLLRRL